MTKLTAHLKCDLMSYMYLEICKFRKVWSYMTVNSLTETRYHKHIMMKWCIHVITCCCGCDCDCDCDCDCYCYYDYDYDYDYLHTLI